MGENFQEETETAGVPWTSPFGGWKKQRHSSMAHCGAPSGHFLKRTP